MLYRFLVTTFAFIAIGFPAYSWDGVDVETGSAVEIERGNLVRSGRDIEVYDTETGEYHDITVDDVNRSGGSVEIEGYDNTTGEQRTFEMED